MEFDLSKPQQLLRKSARELFARECPAKRVRELMAGESAFDRALAASPIRAGSACTCPSPAAGSD